MDDINDYRPGEERVMKGVRSLFEARNYKSEIRGVSQTCRQSLGTPSCIHVSLQYHSWPKKLVFKPAEVLLSVVDQYVYACIKTASYLSAQTEINS